MLTLGCKMTAAVVFAAVTAGAQRWDTRTNRCSRTPVVAEVAARSNTMLLSSAEDKPQSTPEASG